MAADVMRWILVAGTGRLWGMPEPEVWCAEAVGEALARYGCGLVLGGWHGVDYVAASSFSRGLDAFRPKLPLSDALIQVVPKGSQPKFQGGHVIYVDSGPAEWVQPLRYADAVVLIGGIGGTFETYRFALQERRPVFPIAGSGRDAARAFEEVTTGWERTGGTWWGVPRAAFAKALARPIASREDASAVADAVVALCSDYFRVNDPNFKLARNKLFVSYNREDSDWLSMLKRHLSALPRDRMSLWDDTFIEPGSDWDRKIREALLTSKAALLLVTSRFLQSQYITENELPKILNAARDEIIKVFWIHIERCAFESSPIARLQAAHDVARPLAELSPAEQNETLGKIAESMTELLGHTADEVLPPPRT